MGAAADSYRITGNYSRKVRDRIVGYVNSYEKTILQTVVIIHEACG